MKKYALYTAVVGRYDNIVQPCVVDDRFDYYLFSNDIQEEAIGVWQVKRIPYHSNDAPRVARWVKTHPESLLPEYDCSLWMDSNIQIADNYVYDRVEQAYADGELVSSVQHSERNCIYDEAIAVLVLHIDCEKAVLHCVRQLKKRHYPKNNGLYETGILFRVHSNKAIEELDRAWWECIDHYSRRDQLSFNYVLWLHKISCSFFFPPSENALNSLHVNYFAHAVQRSFHITKDKYPFYYWYKKTKGSESISSLNSIYSRIINHGNPYIYAWLWGKYRWIKWRMIRKNNNRPPLQGGENVYLKNKQRLKNEVSQKG